MKQAITQRRAKGRVVRLASASEIPQGQGKAYGVDGQAIAVFNVGGSFYAIDNSCPHKKGPLANGSLEGTVVTCPWHGWEFELTTGQVLHDERCRVACYTLELEDGDILVAC